MAQRQRQHQAEVAQLKGLSSSGTTASEAPLVQAVDLHVLRATTAAATTEATSVSAELQRPVTELQDLKAQASSVATTGVATGAMQDKLDIAAAELTAFRSTAAVSATAATVATGTSEGKHTQVQKLQLHALEVQQLARIVR
jgi:hypothetical protein